MDPSSAPSICPVCHQSVAAEWFFCPNCGKNLKEKPPSTTWLTQTGLYIFAIFLTPLGLWPGIRYFRSRDEKAHQIGVIVIVLTVLSFVVTAWLFASWFSRALQETTNSINSFGNY